MVEKRSLPPSGSSYYSLVLLARFQMNRPAKNLHFTSLPALSHTTPPQTYRRFSLRTDGSTLTPVHPRDGAYEPACCLPAQTTHLLPPRLQPATERSFFRRSITCIRAKDIRSIISPRSLSPAPRTAEGSLR